MRRIGIIVVFAFLCSYTNTYAQLSTNEQPVSFDSKQGLTEISRNAITVATMPELDMERIQAEDKEDEEYGMPPRFGYQHIVNYDLNNSGTWYSLPNGDKLWQLEVVCPQALSVNFCYNRFWIPEGGKLFVYSKDRKQSIGAFTSKNNKGDRENIRGFATGLVYGSDVVLEYYQPKEVVTDAIISIEYIVHGYRFVNFGEKSFGDAGSCMVNINCEEGQEWQNEKKAVARIIIEGARYCSGSLITTTNLNEEPFFLTANHCIVGYGDAANDPNLDYTFFYWNYEAPGCANISVEPTNYHTTSGATILANNSYSDFALLRLTEDPKDISGYTPYYLGWDCSGQCGAPGVCIHHPKGDVKKISTVDGLPISSDWNGSNYDSHWSVGWKSTLNGHGMTQGGSSGSPLLNAMHRVIGQLHGSNCQDCTNPNGRSMYGKFNISWTGNGNNSIYRRLNCWIDSLNTGEQTMEGLLVIPEARTMITNQQLYSNIRITNSGQLTVQSEVEMMGNSRLIVESGGKLIINGGTLSNVNLVLKPGATLRIINGGILDSRNAFEAPTGAIVDIQYGQIL